MRMPAQRTLEHQAALPSQAEGGFAGDLHSSVHKALVAWEKKRYPNGNGFKFGRAKGMFAREKTATATRDELSWNAAPEVKTKDPSKQKMRDESQKERNREYMRQRRAKETPEEKAIRLAKRRADRMATLGYAYKPRPKMTPEERKASVKAAKARYTEKQKQGLAPKRVYKPVKLTPEQLKTKAARQREKYHERKNQSIRTA